MNGIPKHLPSPAAAPARSSVIMRSLADVPMAAAQEDDPSVLIKGPALERSGTLFVVSPAGTGKSVMATQMAMCFKAGIPFAGLVPRAPMDMWVVQREDSARRIATDREDIMRHLGSKHPDIDWKAVTEGVMYPVFPPVRGEEFLALLRNELELARTADKLPDVICLNPLFSFIGGDITLSQTCGGFFRGDGSGDRTSGLGGILEAFDIGAIIFHHTTKPPTTDRELRSWLNSPYPEYLACGSSELINFGRTFLTLMKVPGHDGLLKLTAGKNGNGLGWANNVCYLAYGKGESVTGADSAHYFRIPEPEELPQEKRPAEKKEPDPEQIAKGFLSLAGDKAVSASEARKTLTGKFGDKIGNAAFDLIRKNPSSYGCCVDRGRNNTTFYGKSFEIVHAAKEKYNEGCR